MNAGPKFRTPYRTTGADLAAALGMKTRAKQTVAFVCSRHGGGMPTRTTVLVDGEYYEVLDGTYRALLAGWTPTELELEPVNPADDFTADQFEG
ncbi:hypothetical protein EN742_06455 [Mesorhizobium sp. M4A.F.Ca.ET.020.02.1.1]|uniref:hypothetical protein n=1 Tax=Mesorhizobium sp. M4A.F.Ca.ET.020.02.1.1 TaxID=2496652 RepID=UPI000FD1BC20|nr:hypothetical protein [Mesorhizobium sp. M4A.F.Ca.ET.020.02.1.1]RVD42853.1 hypothetical protein EN742_06455 [Mesorhizobium sp. M4A.F.Ca.ET.020.02.1.1]